MSTRIIRRKYNEAYYGLKNVERGMCYHPREHRRWACSAAVSTINIIVPLSCLLLRLLEQMIEQRISLPWCQRSTNSNGNSYRHDKRFRRKKVAKCSRAYRATQSYTRYTVIKCPQQHDMLHGVISCTIPGLYHCFSSR